MHRSVEHHHLAEDGNTFTSDEFLTTICVFMSIEIRSLIVARYFGHRCVVNDCVLDGICLTSSEGNACAPKCIAVESSHRLQPSSASDPKDRSHPLPRVSSTLHDRIEDWPGEKFLTCEKFDFVISRSLTDHSHLTTNNGPCVCLSFIPCFSSASPTSLLARYSVSYLPSLVLHAHPMTIRVEKESSDHRIYSIDVAFQRLRQLVLTLQNVDEIVISICDLQTKRELTESIVLSLSLLLSDAGTKGVVDLIPHKQQYNTPVTASSSTVAVATTVADACFADKDTNDDNWKALASPISAESTIINDNVSHKDTEAHDRELSDYGSRVHADAPVRVHDPLPVLCSLFDRTCGLYFGVDTMLSQIESTSRLRRRDLANQSSQGIPDTVNTGNGELTRGSMTKVFDYLMLHASS